MFSDPTGLQATSTTTGAPEGEETNASEAGKKAEEQFIKEHNLQDIRHLPEINFHYSKSKGIIEILKKRALDFGDGFMEGVTDTKNWNTPAGSPFSLDTGRWKQYSDPAEIREENLDTQAGYVLGAAILAMMEEMPGPIDELNDIRKIQRWIKKSPKKVVTQPIAKGSKLIPKYWKKSVNFDGTKVYQRDDLFDPHFIDDRGRSNIQRMEEGIAPIGKDGKSINLHHTIQTESGSLVEMTETFHQQNKKIIHINPTSIQSGINRSKFKTYKQRYWKNRAKGF